MLTYPITSSASGPPATSPLVQSDLLAYWELKELGSAANATDLIIPLSMGPTGSVGTATGLASANARRQSSTATGYLMNNGGAAAVAGATNRSFCCWVYLETLPNSGGHYTFTTKASSSSVADYWLRYDQASARFRLDMNSSTTVYTVSSNNYVANVGAIATGTWYCLMGGVDTSNNLWIDVNPSEGGAVTYNSTTGPSTVRTDGQRLMTFARWGTTGGSTSSRNFRIERLAMINKSISELERNWLYYTTPGIGAVFSDYAV